MSNMINRAIPGFLAGLLLLTGTGFSQSTNKDWENPGWYEINKEAPRVLLVYPSAGERV
jgi:hypothetical protein